jgi:mRNA interferase MazF
VEKDFDGWNKKKKEIEQSSVSHVYFHEREIWWACLGVNIGFEQDGKNKDFERPVLIIKKFNAHVVLIVPLTSTVKVHKYYASTTYGAVTYSIILSQLRLISSKRLTRKIRRLPQQEFAEVTRRIKDFM